MNIKFLIGWCLAVILGATLSAQAQTLTCGQVTNGTISFVGAVNTYILSATAGDVVRFTTLGTSGGVCPDVEILNPSGLSVGSFGCNDGISTLRLTNTGVHTVRIRDRDNNNMGNYVFGVVFATPKCTAIPLSCGQVLTNALTNTVQQHTYSISGVAGDVIRLTTRSSTTDVDVDVFNPNGTFFATALFNDGVTTLRLTNTGTYTLLARDRGNDGSGLYSLSLVYATPKCTAIPLSCGQVTTNSFFNGVEQHAYVINGFAGEAIRLVSSSLSGGVCADMSVFTRLGTLVGTIGCGDAVSTLTLPSTDTYSVLVRSRGNLAVGSYSLVLDAVGGCFQLRVGSTVARTQEVACLPLRTIAGSPATALNFTLRTPVAMTNFSLNIGSRFATATVTSGTNSQWFVRLRTSPENPLIGDETIGSLCFISVSTQSMFVPLVLSNLSVTNLDGSVPGASGSIGRAVIIADQSLVEAWFETNRQRMITTYGKPNTGYEIRSRSAVPGAAPWTLAGTNLVPGAMFYSQPLTGPASNALMIFLQANER
jgi:hypothetical protein